jgi:hypothetical protein
MASAAENVARLRAMLRGRSGIGERRMFGGVCFMQGEHMLCCAGKSGFLFRVGEAGEAALLTQGGEVMEMGGRRMRGFVRLKGPDRSDGALAQALALAEAHVRALPPKPPRRAGKELKA